jgi:hypothetical protein
VADEDEKERTGATFFSFEWLLFEHIANALKDCGWANLHHDISMSRGASLVRSKCGWGGQPFQLLHSQGFLKIKSGVNVVEDLDSGLSPQN